MDRFTTTFLIGAIILAALVCPAWNAAAQELDLAVVDPRPLAAAIRTLEDRHGWVITYEDPPYMFKGDIVDVSAWVQKQYNPERPTLTPHGGLFVFGYELPGNPDDPTVRAAVVDELVERFNASGHPGRFRASHSPRMSHVVPVSVRGADGRLGPVSSILDTPISLPRQFRAPGALIEAVGDAIEEATGTPIRLATAGINWAVRQMDVETGADDEPARTVLVRLLVDDHGKRSWRLFFGIRDRGEHRLPRWWQSRGPCWTRFRPSLASRELLPGSRRLGVGPRVHPMLALLS